MRGHKEPGLRRCLGGRNLRTAPGTARGRVSRTSRTCRMAQPCGFGSTSRRKMGRAGIEPATLGLKVLTEPLRPVAKAEITCKRSRVVDASNCIRVHFAEASRYSRSYSRLFRARQAELSSVPTKSSDLGAVTADCQVTSGNSPA